MKSLSALRFAIAFSASLIVIYLASCSRSKDTEEKQDITKCYKMADEHWSEEEYKWWLYETVYEETIPYDIVSDTFPYWNLVEQKREYFSHHLPDKKTDQYYEMIGKYEQFRWGWDDYNGELQPDGSVKRSPNWESYLQCLEGATGNNKLLPTQFNWNKFEFCSGGGLS